MHSDQEGQSIFIFYSLSCLSSQHASMLRGNLLPGIVSSNKPAVTHLTVQYLTTGLYSPHSISFLIRIAISVQSPPIHHHGVVHTQGTPKGPASPYRRYLKCILQASSPPRYEIRFLLSMLPTIYQCFTVNTHVHIYKVQCNILKTKCAMIRSSTLASRTS